MSDIEDHMYQVEPDEVGPPMHDMEDTDAIEEEAQPPKVGGQPQRDAFGDEEEEEEDGNPEERDPEEDEDEDDEDDEDDEEEDGARKGKKRAKHRHKRSAASRFIDLEAEVSDEDEEEEEEDEDYGGVFIDTVEDGDEDATRLRHTLLDNKRQTREEEDKSPEQIARDLSRRYSNRGAVRYTGDMNEIPQRLLMPSVHDASLWQVRVKPGRERDIVFSLMRKSIDVEYTNRPLQILSAFQRDSLPGMIYVEARSSKQVSQACNGLVGVYPSRGIQLVPIEEMASLLQIKKQDLVVTPGSWVRIRRGKYAGDLAQVMDITENGEDVGLKFIPRIDLNPRDDGSGSALDARKRKKGVAGGAGSMRPPQRLFNYEEIIKVWGRKHVSRRRQAFVFQNDTYKDGFIEKDFKLSALILEDVNPTLDEITQFTRRQDGVESGDTVDLSIIAEASRKAAISVLQPGDHVEVFEGEQAGVHGVVDEIVQDVVTITAVGVDIDGQKVELPARSVRKRFKPGDHVKVMSGQNADETGLVVSVADNVVTFLSDMSMQEVSVFSKDLREAAEVGSGTNIVGNYELHDLVQLDLQTVGVIFKTERDSFRVLDQNGHVRLVQPHQISMRRDSTRAIAMDSEGHELRINDNMKEIDGEGRKGRVLHIHQSFFAFLHNRDIPEHGGVFVTRARALASLAPKGSLVKPAADLSKMNPALVAPTGGMVGSGAMGRGPRDRHIGVTVVAVKGPYKGYVGTIKDTNGQIARVELRTGNKVISIEKEKLRRRLPDGTMEPLEGGGGRFQGQNQNNRGSNPYNNGNNSSGANSAANAGGKTPWGAYGRTPHASSATPAWTSSRTPNPYADGSKTPAAWNAHSRTPNPDISGRTPAWNAGSRTPAWGGATPGRGGWGGATPRAGGWGGATPGRQAPAPAAGAWGTEGEGWGSPPRPAWSDSAWSAPTPAATAATPGFTGAPTPMAAPTPAALSTPASYSYGGSGGGNSAPTPGIAPHTYEEPDTSDFELDPMWLFDPAFANYQTRLLVEISGTKAEMYLDGAFEGRTGRVAGLVRVASEFEQTATIVFDAGGETRGVPVRYVIAVAPQYMGQDALVLDGKHKGRAVAVRETPDDVEVTVSLKEDPSAIFTVGRDRLAALAEG